MTTAAQSEAIAEAWLSAFNSGDVEGLVALYADDCRHTSPKLRVLHPETGGFLVGKSALRGWWAGAIARLPGLRYEKTALTASADRVLLEYLRHAPGESVLPVAEVFDVRAGRIVASRVYHG